MSKQLQRWRVIAVAVVVMLVAAGVVAVELRGKPVATPQSSAPVEPGSAPSSDPLLISDIKSRQYPGSPITVTQELGDQGGYDGKVISFKSDGLTEYALQATPRGQAPVGGWPVVILLHGYIPPQQYRTTGADYQSWIQYLSEAGYVVIKPDFRGHGNSQGLAEGGHFSPAYTYDTLNLIASLKQYPVVNAGRLGLIGHSMGAHVALRTAVVSPDVKASVYVSGVVGSFYDLVFNWPRPPYVNDQPIASTRSRLDQLKQEHGDPKTNPDFWNQASAINYVKNVAGPVQIDHGGADSSVPQLFSDHLNQALVDAHKPVEYFNYPGSDHQFSNSADRTLLLQRMRQLFDIALR